MNRIQLLIGIVFALFVTMGSNTVIQESTAEAEGMVFDIGVTGGPPFQWSPTNSTVTVGTTIRWSVTGTAPHTVTSEGCFDARLGPCTFDTGAAATDFLRPGTARSSFEYSFSQPGIYPFFCRLHGGPGGAGQSGVIVVYEPGKNLPSGAYHASAAQVASINAERATAAAPAPAPAAIRPPATGDAGLIPGDKLDRSLFVPLAGIVTAVGVIAITRILLRLQPND